MTGMAGLRLNAGEKGSARPAWINTQALSIAALAVILLVQLEMVFGRAINWDEFYHYSRVEMLARGTLTLPLQTLYTRFFAWVVHVPGSVVEHILLIRVFMYLSEIAILAAIVGIAGRFADRTVALLCALGYLSAGFVLQHGFSFRFDAPTAALLMLALWVLLRSRLDAKAILATGLLLGLAFMMTIKAVLYAPAFAGILWLRWTELGRSPAYALRVACTGFLAAIVFALVYWLHARGLGEYADEHAKAVIASSSGKMFSLGIPPYWRFAVKGAILAPVLTLFILAFPIALMTSDFRPAERLALLGLFLPLTTLAFYHNSAPYYYTFMLPPVVVACAASAKMLAARYGAGLLALLMLVCALTVRALEPPSPIDKQRQLIEAAEAMFPEPVAYFDFSGMLGRFPKANIFMTPWGGEQYRMGMSPSMEAIMARETVPLVMANDPMFDAVFEGQGPAPEFLPQDVAAMRSTYIHLWGPYWVAGRQVPGDSAVQPVEILVPGPYTVRDGAVRLDGVTYQPGAIINLARGRHEIGAGGARDASLVWGRDLRVPDSPPPPEPYVTSF